MTKIKKNHYRKVFKSDHLSSYDLEDFQEEGRPLDFTIKHVQQEMNVKVAGKKINANIAYFVEPIKPLVLNATNSKIISKMVGSNFVQDWNDLPIELYIQKGISFGKETVQGIRIKEEKPKIITDKDVKMISGKLAIITDLKGLNAFYGSLSVRERTNKNIIQLLKDKQTDLKQV
tara:strand:+ start:1728 stop:2252 length:525 start_codon:yes stop_codon:yes gene_type:complete